MSAAHSAAPGESVAKVLASAMQPHGEIVFREPKFRSHFRRLLPLKIDLLQKIAVLFRHHRQEAFEALAEDAFVVIAWRLRQILFESFEGTASSPLSAIDVDDRAPEDTVKPLRRSLLAFGLTVRCKCFDEAFLNNVFGQMRVAEPIAGECHEHLQIADKQIFDGRHLLRLRTAVSPCNIECNDFRGAAFAWMYDNEYDEFELPRVHGKLRCSEIKPTVSRRPHGN